MTWYLIVSFLVLMALGAPVAVALGLGSLLAISITGKLPLAIAVHRMTTGLDSFVLLAIPFFILAGNLMNTGGITQRIFRFADALVGRIPGGLGHANVVASMIFAGMSGSAVADAGGLGAVELKAMDEAGFDKEFSAAITAASSTIGPIIPPSIPMVVYGVMAEVSIGRLFLGGFIPGVLTGLALMLICYYLAKKRNYPRRDRMTLQEHWETFRRAFLPVITPVIIIGGIILGVFTPTEAAVVAVVYAFLLGFLLYREITWKDLHKIAIDTTVTTASVAFIIAGAAAFAWLVAIEGIPNRVADFVLGISTNKWVILGALNIIFLILGMFMETLSILIITVPVLLPLISRLQIDPAHFGVMLVLNLMIGLITPPVGMSLFVTAKVARIKLERLYGAIVPFVWPIVVVLALITYWPPFVTWLPRLVLGR